MYQFLFLICLSMEYGVVSYSPFWLQSWVISGSVVPLQCELQLFYRKILYDCTFVHIREKRLAKMQRLFSTLLSCKTRCLNKMNGGTDSPETRHPWYRTPLVIKWLETKRPFCIYSINITTCTLVFSYSWFLDYPPCTQDKSLPRFFRPCVQNYVA